MSDAVNKPAHYNQGPIECIDAMQIVLTPEEYRGFLKGNVFKYLWREKGKNGIEDLRKGKDYYDRLIDSFEANEPEQSKPTLNSDTIPEGYRKLNDSSEEPRQRGDLRWSIAEKRYIEIGFEEIGYANRENWAACRKITEEVTGEVKPPDGWRWLEVGESLRKGDTTNTIEPIPEHWVGTQCVVKHVALRRNKFEVGEKVVHGDSKSLSISVVGSILGDGWLDLIPDGFSTAYDGFTTAYHVKDLAPYIEDAIPEITEEVKPPDGWRWLERGEVIRKGDKPIDGIELRLLWVGTPCANNHFILRRNRFEVGEKVVHGDLKSTSISTVKSVLSDGWVDLVRDGVSTAYHVKDLAPYIEDAIPEITGEVKPPDGWRWLERGEVIRKGDKYRDLKSQTWIEVVSAVGDSLQDFHKPTIRRNRFEVGEKVVHVNGINVCEVVECDYEKNRYAIAYNGSEYAYESKWLAPYIEETK